MTDAPRSADSPPTDGSDPSSRPSSARAASPGRPGAHRGAHFAARQARSRRRGAALGLAAALIVAAVVSAYAYTSTGKKTGGGATPGSARTAAAASSPPASTVAAKDSAATTPPGSKGAAASVACKPPTTVSPGLVHIEVTNGSGVYRQATQTATALQKLGYKASINFAATSYNYPHTLIQYAPDSAADAHQVQGALRSGGVLQLNPSLTPTPYNIEIVTGKDFAGVASPASGASTAGSAPAGASSSPGC